ncbi:MAG: hypothetical protein QG643_1013, partial [Pseudomonadota bacterium]|nr:hypothetical protein [Pseudomonadota bacterium]
FENFKLLICMEIVLNVYKERLTLEHNCVGKDGKL